MLSRRSFVGALASAPLILRANDAGAETGFGETGRPTALELAQPDMERIAFDMWVGEVASDIWVISFTSLLNSRFWHPANGGIIRGADGLTFVDPGWNRSGGEALLRFAQERIEAPVARVVSTHFHEDRTGGIGAFRRADIPVLAHPALARAYGTAEPDPFKELAARPISIGPVELFFPAPGHTRDNITMWHEPSRTLVGGCLLKSTTSRDLGNLEDGDVTACAPTLRRLANRYPSRKVVVPGHGSIAGDAVSASQTLVARHDGL